MEISLSDLKKLIGNTDFKKICKEQNLSTMTDICTVAIYPPNEGQETIRNVFKALGYKFDENEEVSIVTYDV